MYIHYTNAIYPQWALASEYNVHRSPNRRNAAGFCVCVCANVSRAHAGPEQFFIIIVALARVRISARAPTKEKPMTRGFHDDDDDDGPRIDTRTRTQRAQCWYYVRGITCACVCVQWTRLKFRSGQTKKGDGRDREFVTHESQTSSKLAHTMAERACLTPQSDPSRVKLICSIRTFG